MRAVLDTNVLISALISRTSTPAELLLRWLNGDVELIVSDQLLAEVSRALAYPKVRSRVSAAEAKAFAELLRASATQAVDPPLTRSRSRDEGDDFVIALAESVSAVVISGDNDLLDLAPQIPVYAAAQFLRQLEADD